MSKPAVLMRMGIPCSLTKMQNASVSTSPGGLACGLSLFVSGAEVSRTCMFGHLVESPEHLRCSCTVAGQSIGSMMSITMRRITQKGSVSTWPVASRSSLAMSWRGSCGRRSVRRRRPGRLLYPDRRPGTVAGRIMGCGCSVLRGHWAIDGDAISFDDVVSTRMACPDVDTWLSELDTARLDRDTMHILDDSGEEIGPLARATAL
ncbi:META domain-containing protein [Dietzia sp. MNB45]|uniref:META domain-containing protein n=1 Tax=Dietzia sp. MNB45 TaxID=3238800 RepID=UPI003F8196A4